MSSALETETESEIRVCVYDGEGEFSWRKQAVQLCVCCVWCHAKSLLPATGTP